MELAKCNIHFFKDKEKALLYTGNLVIYLGSCNISTENQQIVFIGKNYNLSFPRDKKIVKFK